MVNSSWTEEHIRQLWGGDVDKVYPPCDVTHLTLTKGEGREVSGQKGEIRILSLGQFRPEKDHPLQIKAIFELRQILPEDDWDRVKLVIVGGCRGKEDWKMVKLVIV